LTLFVWHQKEHLVCDTAPVIFKAFLRDTGIARIFSGDALFSSKKRWRPFLFLVFPQNRLKLLNEPLQPSKSPSPNVQKIDSCSVWGALSAWGALTNIPCKLCLKNFFSALGVADVPTAPPGYAYAQRSLASPGQRGTWPLKHLLKQCVVLLFIEFVLFAWHDTERVLFCCSKAQVSSSESWWLWFAEL